MKTILKYDSRIQLILILILMLTILAGILSKQNFFFKVFCIIFFLLAIVQYTLNIIKFFSKYYVKTDSRKIYILLSTYVVIGFLTGILSLIFDLTLLKNIFEIMTMSWIVLSPILIIFSLSISSSDSISKNKNP